MITALLSLAVSVTASARTYTLKLDQVEKALKEASAGDTLLVASGVYQDLQMKWQGRGTLEKPVVVMAERPGEVIVQGASELKIYGEYLQVHALFFKHCIPTKNKGALVEFRNGDKLAQHCRLSNCVIDDYNARRRDFPSSYIQVYGRNNRVDHNSFTGKKSLGVTLIVMLNYDRCDENAHLIEYNYFGPRPVYGSNGAETIRVGTSQQCMQNSRSLIRHNLFYRCNGEVEVVSIKSSENSVCDNVFYECQGVLALRHGDRNEASRNLFIGNGVMNTGGIRIVGEEQVVKDNRFFSLAGDRFFSALALMNAVPNSLPNRYMQVKGCYISGNRFVDCASIEYGTGADFERTLAPASNTFENNLIYNTRVSAPIEAQAPLAGNVFTDNRVCLAPKSKKVLGFLAFKGPKPEIPAWETCTAGMGAAWFVEEKTLQAGERRQILVSAADDLPALIASAQAQSEFVLTDSLYLLEKSLEVKTKMSIKSLKHSVIRFVGLKSENMITLCDGADLRVEGLCFDGSLTSGKSLAKSAISTAEDMLEPYRLTLKDCRFVNYGESGFIPVKGTAGTFADKVVIEDCSFQALSGDGINYAAELDDKGRYNADSVVIQHCHFERILGLPIHIYRGGSDESTAGPYVFVTGCTFDDCSNKVRGSVMKIIGAQILEINDCHFSNSGRGGYSIRLDDAPWERIQISGNTFVNSGKILSNREIHNR